MSSSSVQYPDGPADILGMCFAHHGQMRIFVFLAFAGIAIAHTGCEGANPAISVGRAGGSSPSDSCPTNRGVMSAQIDSERWTSTCVQTAAWVAGVLSIVGTNGTEVIALTVNAVVPGTADALQGASGAITLPATGATWASGPGGAISITLTRIDLAGADGTFSFSAAAVAGTSATGTRTVTNGIFNVRF